MRVRDMRMLRLMCRHTKRDKIRNENIRAKLCEERMAVVGLRRERGSSKKY
ncbi:hypothetical protein H5410_026194 [Solanum commersonii]|uniref:Uncharacterized protein n=1 Tax=Solanum commersonii TaxID=4109 RepID=A0A9J5Z0S6_SOLCO|nr:hypothetical protein H5410_026194 [Solanum commersonii]